MPTPQHTQLQGRHRQVQLPYLRFVLGICWNLFHFSECFHSSNYPTIHTRPWGWPHTHTHTRVHTHTHTHTHTHSVNLPKTVCFPSRCRQDRNVMKLTSERDMSELLGSTMWELTTEIHLYWVHCWPYSALHDLWHWVNTCIHQTRRQTHQNELGLAWTHHEMACPKLTFLLLLKNNNKHDCKNWCIYLFYPFQ